MTATDLINKYNLIEHPEGGYYKVTHLSDIIVNGKPAFSLIYFLLTETSPISHLHKIPCDEVWNWYEGQELVVIEVLENKLKCTILGKPDYQHVVKANTWFGSMLYSTYAKITEETYNATKGYALVGCTCAPAFSFDDFKLYKKETKDILPKMTGPSLKHFILKSQVINLYRDILRTCNNVKKTGSAVTAKDLQTWARGEIELNKNVNENEVSKLIVRGRSQLRDIQKTLALADRFK